MKILIMNDYLVYGGAEMQSIREKKILQENGHEVFLLTFDPNFPQDDKYYNNNNNFFNVPINKSFIKKIMNIVDIKNINKELLIKIRDIIDTINPDIIHANNLMLDSITQFEAVKNKMVFQTIRDYTAVCPLGTCIKANGEVCKGEKFNKCYKACAKSFRDIAKIAAHKKINIERKKIIKEYISPSETLTKICYNNDYNIKCINNPFDFEKFKDFMKNIDFKEKKYLYYGTIDSNKGILQLIDAFDLFQKNRKVELLIAGKVDAKIEKIFYSKINNKSYIKYLGKLDYNDMIKVIETIHTIVVPSIWMENYPNTVLEGLSTGTFVIGSTRGGIPEMLENNRGLVFDPDNIKNINKALIEVYNMEKEEYEKKISINKSYVQENNSFEKYYSRLMLRIEEIKFKKEEQ